MPATIYPLAISSKAPVSAAGARKRVTWEVFNFASDAVGTYPIGAPIPVGARVIKIEMIPSVSLGTTTVAIGITGATGKYRAAATLTTPDAVTTAALNAAVGVPLAAEEQLIMTTAVAALPASGNLKIAIEWCLD